MDSVRRYAEFSASSASVRQGAPAPDLPLDRLDLLAVSPVVAVLDLYPGALARTALPGVVANAGAERDRGYAQPSCLRLIPSFQIFVM
jgi:hypothetical protein